MEKEGFKKYYEKTGKIEPKHLIRKIDIFIFK